MEKYFSFKTKAISKQVHATQVHATTPLAFSVVLRLRFLCRILQKRKNKTFFETSIATEEKKKQSK